MNIPILSLILWHGLIAAIIMSQLARSSIWLQKSTAVIISMLGCGLTGYLWYGFIPNQAFQFVEKVPWIAHLGAFYHLGVDGISLNLVILTMVIVFLSILSICVIQEKNIASACTWVFLVQAMSIGAFLALDGLLFYLFWEASLLPMFLYIGLCGGGNRWFAARKYFLFSLFGSLFFLVSILYLGLKAGDFSFSSFYQLQLNLNEQLLLFTAFTLAFAIKLPMFPLHSWLPDAHTQASTSGSMLLAAILLKLGGYGFMRFNLPITPDASMLLAPLMTVLSIIAIIYIGFVAAVQSDIKRLIAYASISHMGMITLGLFVAYLMPGSVQESTRIIGISGVLVHMISHGLSSAGLFLCFGLVYHRLGTRDIKDYGGLMRVMPIYSGFFMLFILSNIGFPGTAGFVGEFFVIYATCAANLWLAGLAVLTMVLSATYSLGLVKQVFYGRVNNMQLLTVMDINWSEKLLLGLLSLMIIGVGIAPDIITASSVHAIKNTVLFVKSGQS